MAKLPHKGLERALEAHAKHPVQHRELLDLLKDPAP